MQIVTVLNIVTCRLDGHAVELDVRTLCDGLVECVLCQGRVGVRNCTACVGTDDISHLGVQLGVAALGLPVHMEVTFAALERNLRIAQVVVVNQIVDLIEIEGVAVPAVEGLVHHFRYDHRVVDVVDPVEINNRAAQTVSLEVKVNLHINSDIDLVVDGILDLVVNIVVDAVVGLVAYLVVEIVVDLVVVGVAVLVVVLVIVAVVVAVLIVTLGIERLNSELGLTLGLTLTVRRQII